jgi:hypothetical protein
VGYSHGYESFKSLGMIPPVNQVRKESALRANIAVPFPCFKQDSVTAAGKPVGPAEIWCNDINECAVWCMERGVQSEKLPILLREKIGY